jgi:hypothetical protein
MLMEISLKSVTTPHAAFMASGLPSLSYVAIIRTGSGYMFGFAPKFTLLMVVPPVLLDFLYYNAYSKL